LYFKTAISCEKQFILKTIKTKVIVSLFHNCD
jgi:hypothetical protein